MTPPTISDMGASIKSHFDCSDPFTAALLSLVTLFCLLRHPWDLSGLLTVAAAFTLNMNMIVSERAREEQRLLAQAKMLHNEAKHNTRWTQTPMATHYKTGELWPFCL